MAGNFWKSSHNKDWILDRQAIILRRYEAHQIFEPALEAQHQKLLIFLCELTQSIGIQMKSKQQIISTATIYMKRFYMRNSFKAVEPMLLSATAIYLASKVDQFENMPLGVLVNACCVVQDRYKYALQKHFPYRGLDILSCEFYLAESLDFSLIVYHPYRPLVTYLNYLPDDYDDGFRTRLLTSAWTVLNDSLRTDVCFLFPPHQIAVASLIVAAVAQGRNDLQTWFMEMEGIDLMNVSEICAYINDYYDFIKTYNQEEEIPDLISQMPKPVLSPPK
ncbi:unnamed protein product [Allacma fusca]|uniref:Cyclin-like domain-containing protein n=1 Tax=Allacma fusca TaxID=39272 RepID=A0A8J2KJR3_9HEXA|nr:unnamed protein product [Allacma fusca]